MRTVLAPVVAAAVWLVGVVATPLASIGLATVEQLESTGGQVAWTSGPQLLVSFAMVLLAGLVYGTHRVAAPAGAAVVLALPAVQVVGVTVAGVLGDASCQVVAARCVAGLVAIAAAWLLLVRLGRGARTAAGRR
ncbi:hypothetical protein ACFOVU_05295 [Nocardiopsis sediminis]|uniref:Integral membrane protein n=1 Tax=Nocardiopsis sediminis TaxID=1778267 RepID=A0ABV8FGR1_9ACTN